MTKKIAIVHEMLVKFGGAEKVVEQFLDFFPDADLFTLIYDEKNIGKMFPKNKIHPDCFSLPSQKIFQITKKQRFCLPFMARSVEQLDMSEYDLVICSSSGFAHGLITKPETQLLVYYHSPARYMWDWTNEYKKDIGFDRGIKGYILSKLFLKLRQWDFIASNRVDTVVANSQNTAQRIKKYYRKQAHILYPPVETKRFQKQLSTKIEKPFKNYYIIISALTEFKKIDIAIQNFNKLPDSYLVIIGKGEHRSHLEKTITGKNIQFVGAQYADDLVDYVQNSQGLIFPGEEDFGIVPIEVMAAGKPIFALSAGGLKETVIAGVTGEFFFEKDGSDFIEKFQLFDKNNSENKYKSDDCIQQAQNFSEDIFHKKLLDLLD